MSWMRSPSTWMASSCWGEGSSSTRRRKLEVGLRCGCFEVDDVAGRLAFSAARGALLWRPASPDSEAFFDFSSSSLLGVLLFLLLDELAEMDDAVALLGLGDPVADLGEVLVDRYAGGGVAAPARRPPMGRDAVPGRAQVGRGEARSVVRLDEGRNRLAGQRVGLVHLAEVVWSPKTEGTTMSAVTPSCWVDFPPGRKKSAVVTLRAPSPWGK